VLRCGNDSGVRVGIGQGYGSASAQAMDGHVEASFRRRRMTPEHRSAKREQGAMSEHRNVRVRAGPPGARCDGQSSQPDVGETGMPGANGFGYFCPQQK
jgi:hypothetical protein